jgi:hypothetical protein
MQHRGKLVSGLLKSHYPVTGLCRLQVGGPPRTTDLPWRPKGPPRQRRPHLSGDSIAKIIESRVLERASNSYLFEGTLAWPPRTVPTLHGGLFALGGGGALGVVMVLLPTFCPDCSGFTMEVVEYRADDSYEARCTVCGYRGFGKIAPELLVAKGAIYSTS